MQLKKSIKNYEEILETCDQSIFKDLTPRQTQYVKAYISTSSRSEAAIKAGYKAEGARISAHALMKKPAVVAAINALKALLAKETMYDLVEAVRQQEEILQKCIELKQMTAAVKAKEHLDILTKHYEPGRVNLDFQGTKPLAIQIFGIAPPPYANPQIDVTPPQQQLNPKKDTDAD